ncbi:Uncharacterized conserved protein YgbK, DUF1537 family [Tistlia consotensis]|uniref:3-oxo-tetronate kinase n=1 Tax=Tistlia consotensis USBA 355 TaxID=560819 RepID=A0A1Y6BKV0_9PROT|nr:3-oxo-tetronate kinase [Tistlia consotensis]SMF16791.1 Uncharacterized conserved protein YgbK, DUF1537 family [Tistlia consotensis USBA 355]SNR40900.1 Uncharacterized conserved protein YgbK, DUF1537 family [Tistlia consotensis]
MTQPLLFGAIADDLTGAAELASLLVAGGVACPLLTGPAAVARLEAPAVVIGQKSRTAPAAEAVAMTARAAEALLARQARQLFFKYCATFDSTAEGNIGPCADRLMALTGSDRTAFCPAFPEVDRTVYQGHLFVAEQLVSRSPKRFDPLTPMTEPDLVQVLAAQTAQRVGLLPHALLAHGAEAVRARVAAEVAAGVAYFVTDGIDEADLRQVAAATVDWPLMTGGSSVAVYYPALWRSRGWLAETGAPPPLPAVAGGAAVLAGSCAPRTLEQLDAFAGKHPLLQLDLAALAADEARLGPIVEALCAAAARGPVAVATSAGPEAVAAIQQRLGIAGAAALAERVLGRCAEALLESGVRRFLVAGGETSGAVVGALGLDLLTVGAYRGPGIGRAVAETPRHGRVALCLKSGKLGPVEMFERVLGEMAA